MEKKFYLRDMHNNRMTNEEAIEIITKNMPDPKRQTVLFDALVKALVALQMTTGDRRIEPRRKEKTNDSTRTVSRSGDSML